MSDIHNEEIEEAMAEAKEETPEVDPAWIAKDKKSLPESPASLNVKFWADGFGVMLTMRAETVSEVLKQFQTIMPFIKNSGYKNVWDKEPITRVLPEQTPVVQNAPICGIHGVPMTWKSGISKTNGKPYAFFACSTKNANGTWCNYQPKS